MNLLKYIVFTACAISALAQSPQSVIRTFRTLAEMDASAPSRTETYAEVLGLDVAGQPGWPRKYRYDYTNSLPTNALIRAVPGGRPGRRVYDWDGSIDVLGVKGDGATDDSAAFQQAANAGSRMVLTKGKRYFIGTGAANAPWDNGGATNVPGVILPSNFTLEGNDATIVFTNGSATFANQFGCFSWDRSSNPSNIVIRNLNFEFQGPAGYYGSAIVMEPPSTVTNVWAQNIRIQNIRASRVRGGIIIRATGLSTNYPIKSVQISDVMIEGTTSTGVTLCGIDGGSLSRLTVQGSEFDGLNIFGVRNFTFSDCTGNDIAEGFPLMSGGTIRRNEFLSFANIVLNGRGVASKADFTSGNNLSSDGTLANVSVNGLIVNNASLNIQGDAWPTYNLTFSGLQVYGGVGSAKRGIYANRVTNLVFNSPTVDSLGGAMVLQNSERVTLNGGSLTTTAQVTNNYGTNVLTLDGSRNVLVSGVSFSGGTNGLFIVGASGSPLGVTVTGSRFANHTVSPVANDGTVTTSFRLRMDNCDFNGTNLTAVTNSYAINRNSYIPLASGLGPKLDLTSTNFAVVTHEFHDIGGSSSNVLQNLYGGQLGQRVTLIGVNSEPVYITGAGAGNIRNWNLGSVVLSGNRSSVSYRYDGTVWLGEADTSFKGATAGAGTDVTIVSGVATSATGYMRVVPEGGAADDLDNIYSTATLGQYDAGKLMVVQLSASAGANAVTVRHNGGGGNIRTSTGSSVVLSNVNKALSFVWDGARWMQID